MPLKSAGYYLLADLQVCLSARQPGTAMKCPTGSGAAEVLNRTSPVSIAFLLPCRRHYPASVVYPFSHSEIAHAVFTSVEQARPLVLES